MPKRRSGGSSKKKNNNSVGGSNYGRPGNNKNRKKKSKGGTNNHRMSRSNNTDIPELMDLSGNIYIPDQELPRNSMKQLSRRPGRLIDEINFTRSHEVDTLRRTFYNRPIEFVKAKEVYDPSVELLKKAAESKIPKEHRDLLELMNSPPVEEIGVPESPKLSSSSEEEGFDDNENEGEEEEIELSGSVEGNNSELESGEPSVILTSSSSGSFVEEIIPQNKETSEVSDNDEPAFLIDEQGDSVVLDQYKQTKPLTSLLIQTRQQSSDEITTETKGGIEHDSVLTIGKVALQTRKNISGELTAELISVEQLNKVTTNSFVDETEIHELIENVSDISDDDVGAYKDYIAQVMKDMRKIDSDFEDDDYESDTNFDAMASSSEEEEEEEEEEQGEEQEKEIPQDPEYGFLPEDYEFDVSQIAVSNVRFGIKNQYYAKCLDFTGSVDDFVWIDEEELHDYVLSKGVKEHRLNSFMKFITKGLIDEEQFELPDYSDVYISETSEEDYSEEQDDENLESLVSFSKSQQKNFMDLDIRSTMTMRTKGKGKKKQLDLDKMDLDNEIRQSLQEQYQIHRSAKSSRKKHREEARLEEGLRKHDLLIKYPYSLHIKDIRDEFDTFLHDTSRESMSFPPLDPHANKTIIKMSKCYNMKATKCGSGLKWFIKVTKNRKTFHYLPRYDQIGSILRQRPIFNRTDQKRPKDEIIRTDGNSKKDKARGRNKLQHNAYVKEGDIVGAEAPEIGHNNIGRILLEKLGWVQGEGLGAHGNKGISEPVVAKIKKSKTGLK